MDTKIERRRIVIESWEQFFGAVSRMREHQKVYFQTKDPVALGMARKLEKLVDECTAVRQERTGRTKADEKNRIQR
jgi:hypothetical protein